MDLSLKQLSELEELARIAKGDFGLNATQLESDFLLFFKYNKNRSLNVRIPKTYEVSASERLMFKNILKLFNIEKSPKNIDISGAFDYFFPNDLIIFSSLEQLNTDHLSISRSYLNPLIEKIYSDGSSLIRDFALHEPIFGSVKCKRGKIDLTEAHLFPREFMCGDYTLSVELDSTDHVISKYVSLMNGLDEFNKLPKTNILDPKKIKEITDEGLKLRAVLGTLSRYERPNKQSFEVNSNSCTIRKEEDTFYYIYLPEKNKNILVYFGLNPFDQTVEPLNLVVLDGRKHQDCLNALISLDYFKPSLPILEQKILSLEKLFEDTTRETGMNITQSNPELFDLYNKLKRTKSYFLEVINDDVRKEYLIKQPSEVLEFVVCPNTIDPVAYEILARLSWVSAIRDYHKTNKFISGFEKANENEKRDIIRNVASSAVFTNQQNNDVNYWLYLNYKDLCESEKVIFNVVN